MSQQSHGYPTVRWRAGSNCRCRTLVSCALGWRALVEHLLNFTARLAGPLLYTRAGLVSLA